MQRLQRLKTSGALFRSSLAVPSLKKKALNSWSAVQDSYFSTKDLFERHKVVFTVSTSIASVATAWAGYSIRYVHQAKVEERLDSIEKAMRSQQPLERKEVEKMVGSAFVSPSACMATAGTSLVIGYALGWRGGIWHANRKFKREQLKLLGQLKPSQKWQFQFLRKRFSRSQITDGSGETLKPRRTFDTLLDKLANRLNSQKL